MKSNPKLLLLLIFVGQVCFAQNIQSPETFLGYKIGDKFSFHSRITDYVKYVAEKNPNQTKLINYGQTNEGRPLQVIIVGSETNIANLETIRTNNLKGIGLADGTSTADIPAIAWLSYNVHGNEAVSSEAVMVVLYELLNKENTVTQDILKNTVVILDPCINPDGRDRYANWYNRYVGKTPDLNAASIEHHEPWPGGRFNHYLFDLNRDWAWQTQVESQQRMKLYHEWMPHLHADFHEMGANSTYYFPPSAKPYHAELTTWQRDFQNLLGEYNKKRFDKNGWLYFTKESYDLLYPSYGDTYPSYNGAIGMTFEQGGSGSAGLAFLREDGDTLTLLDRINHHVATSMGTLEAISENKQNVISNFRKYFNDAAANGVGEYKTYVIKTEGNEAAVAALKKTLD
ncbi:MAG: M14 family metallopeptidase, partial [Spirosomaceae bacterium]|nr:M14 family metallopeptidase [Spirosomataceae bacterium]